MGFLTPTVPREMYEREKERADRLQDNVETLTKELTRLKKKGYEGPHEAKPGRVIQAGPSADELAAQRAHDEALERAAKDLEHLDGLPRELARAEAARLRGLITGGSVTEPPL